MARITTVRRASRLRRGLGLVACLALMPALACSSSDDLQSGPGATPTVAADAEWDDIVAAAEEEGRVVLYYSIYDETFERLEEAFEAEYPEIDLEGTRVPAQVDTTLASERDSGTDGADMVHASNLQGMVALAGADDLAAPVGPNATEGVWDDPVNLYRDLFGLHALTAVCIGWNTDLVAGDPPEDYPDLLDPAYRGRVGIVDITTSETYADYYAFLEDRHDGYLEDLAAQAPVIYPSTVPLEQALAAGEVMVAPRVTVSGIATARAAGAPVECVPEEVGLQSYSYILGWSTRPNAAQVLFDFMASEAGQVALGVDTYSVVDGAGTLGPVTDDVHLLDVEQLLEPEWWDGWIERWNGTFR